MFNYFDELKARLIEVTDKKPNKPYGIIKVIRHEPKGEQKKSFNCKYNAPHHLPQGTHVGPACGVVW